MNSPHLPACTIDVVIPVINERDRIRACVASASDAGANRIWVVDGGSTDGTLDVVEQLPCQVIHSAPGRARQMNAGAAAGQGSVLLFLHADCRLAPAAGEQIAELAAREREFFGGFIQRIDAAGTVYRMIERGNAWRASRRRLVYGDQGMLISRSLWDRLGPFPDVPLMEDYLLSSQLGRVIKPVVLPGPLHVDARRWKAHGPIRQTLKNWSIVWRFRMGWDVQDLADSYRRHDRDHLGTPRDG